MTTKERLRLLVEAMTDEQAERAIRALERIAAPAQAAAQPRQGPWQSAGPHPGMIDRGDEVAESVSETTGLSLRLLGAWRLHDGVEEVPTTSTMRRLLALLALQGPTHRSAAAAELWPDSPARRAAGSLRELLLRTRLAHPDLITVGRDTVALARTVRVDVPVLRAAVERLRRAPSRAAEMSDELVNMCTAGDLLPGWSDPWVETEREQLRQLQQIGLELLASHLEPQDDGVPAFVGSFASGDGHLSGRIDELLADGFGR